MGIVCTRTASRVAAVPTSSGKARRAQLNALMVSWSRTLFNISSCFRRLRSLGDLQQANARSFPVVQKDRGTSLFLAFENQDGYSPLCCQHSYDNTTQSCPEATLGSFEPFSLPVGRIIYNRTDGSVMMNGTLTTNNTQHGACDDAQTTVSQNQTATQNTTECSATGSASVTAVASGIAVPLGVLLLASIVAIVVLLRQNRSLKKLSRQGSLVGHSPASQMGAGHGRADGGKGQGQTVYGYSPPSEMSDERAPVESGGRPVASELPARVHE